MTTATRGAADCTPNIGPEGARRRLRLSQMVGLMAAACAVALVALDTPAPARALCALPAMAAMITWLQVRRSTCVAHAATGTIEVDGGKNLRAPELQAAASRAIARTIWRDGVLFGVGVGLLAAATAWIR